MRPRPHHRPPHSRLPKDFGTERQLLLEGQAHHIIAAALYTLAAHEHHWDPTAISAMLRPPQGPNDPVTPLHIDQLINRRANPHLHPSRIELAIASWDTLDTPPQQPAVHILKADAQWWVLHWANGVLMAAQAYTQEKDPETPNEAGSDSSNPPPSQAGCTAMANRPPGDRTQARRPHTQPRKSDHTNAGRTPAKGPRPAVYAPLLPTPRPPSPTASSPTQASKTEKRRTRLRPPASQKRRQGNHLPTPCTPPPTLRANPDQASPSSSLPPPPPPHPDQASSSSFLPPPAPPQPETYPEFKKGAKVQQPFRIDHQGDRIWFEGTIQYRLRDLGPNNAVQVRVIWHRQKELDQGNSAPDKPEGHRLELNSAHPIRLLTAQDKTHRGTKYTGELPPEWSQGLPPPRLPKRPPPGKESPSPNPPP